MMMCKYCNERILIDRRADRYQHSNGSIVVNGHAAYPQSEDETWSAPPGVPSPTGRLYRVKLYDGRQFYAMGVVTQDAQDTVQARMGKNSVLSCELMNGNAVEVL